MQFHKDILVIDFEGKREPVQIGAVLLDKESLIEKDSFSSYIYTDLQGYISPTTGITQDLLDTAPTQSQIGRTLIKKFGMDFFIGSWVCDLDIQNFKKIIVASEMEWGAFDYHVLDIWPIAYIHLLKQGYTGGFRSEEMFSAFGASPRDKHDALEDARIAADVLRKIVLYK